ncbi:A/G-specific adenine glycosylase, partial [Sphingomonas sp. HMWF008]
DTPPGLADPPFEADWQMLPETVAHVFTHFRLELALAVARADGQAGTEDHQGTYWATTELDSAGLPTVFAKAATAIRRAIW